jgi:hypothetical protein
MMIEIWREPCMKHFVKIVIGIVVLSTLGVLGKVVLYPIFVANKAVETGYEITEKTLDADNVLQNYEWFKMQYEDYVAINSKINNAEVAAESFRESAGDRKEWTFEDKTEDARLQTIVTGLKQQREDIIAEYNAKSKMQNRNLFKDKNLPDQLPIE